MNQSSKEMILRRLQEEGIACQVFAHEAAHTMEDCLALPYAAPDVTFCKNILLCNRQMTAFFLYVTLPDQPFRTSEVSKLLGSSRLSFAPPECLMQMLNLESGSLSPLALWSDTGNKIVLAFDRRVCRPGRIAFHPADNTATVIFRQDVFWQQVVPLLEHETRWIHPEST